MERVVVLGCSGAGKSELARRLGEREGLPVVHLDVLFWRPGWELAPEEEARSRLRTAIGTQRWIIEGNFLPKPDPAADPRFSRADTVIFLDLPRRTCLRRVLARVAADRGGRRPDLPEGCDEGADLELLRWIWRYPRRNRPRVLQLLAGLAPGVAVHHLRSPTEVRRFLDSRLV